MASPRPTIAARYNAPTVTLGGLQERRFRQVALHLTQAALDLDTIFPDGSSKTSMLSALDTVITDLNTLAGAISNS